MDLFSTKPQDVEKLDNFVIQYIDIAEQLVLEYERNESFPVAIAGCRVKEGGKS